MNVYSICILCVYRTKGRGLVVWYIFPYGRATVLGTRYQGQGRMARRGYASHAREGIPPQLDVRDMRVVDPQP